MAGLAVGVPRRFPPAMGTLLGPTSRCFRTRIGCPRAAELKVGPERVALMGQSARAHFAALVARAGDVAPFFLVVSELKLR
jgi:hypothetical protein